MSRDVGVACGGDLDGQPMRHQLEDCGLLKVPYKKDK